MFFEMLSRGMAGRRNSRFEWCPTGLFVVLLAVIPVLVLLGIALGVSVGTDDTSLKRPVFVAHRDSPFWEKRTADYICSGINDDSVIQAALNEAAGGEVVLAAGSYKCSGLIRPPASTLLRGQGATATTLSFTGAGRMLIANPYVTITDLAISSSAHTYAWEGVVNVEASHAAMRNVIGTADATQCAVFYVVAGRSSTPLTDIEFTGCTAKDPQTFGWLFEAATNTESLKVISNVRMTDCAALNCGRYGQFNDWIAGIDVSETSHLAYSTITRCRAEGCWESGFHMETPTTKTAVAFNDCTSRNNAQKTVVTGRPSTFGAGFMVGGDSTLASCISVNNQRGFMCNGAGSALIRCIDRDSYIGYQIDNITPSAGLRIIECHAQHEQFPLIFNSGQIVNVTVDSMTITGDASSVGREAVVFGPEIEGRPEIFVHDLFVSGYSNFNNNQTW